MAVKGKKLSVSEQIELLKAKLIALAPDVTQEMINQAVTEEGLSDDTFKRYLKGEVRQLAFGKVVFANLSEKVNASKKKDKAGIAA
jgi:type II secretory pathway component PulM